MRLIVQLFLYLALFAPALRSQPPETWRVLVAAPEHRCTPYHSKDYRYPQSVEPQIVASMGGRIYGPYTGREFASMRQTDIEHIAARSEAHDSGLYAASGEGASVSGGSYRSAIGQHNWRAGGLFQDR